MMFWLWYAIYCAVVLAGEWFFEFSKWQLAFINLAIFFAVWIGEDWQKRHSRTEL